MKLNSCFKFLFIVFFFVSCSIHNKEAVKVIAMDPNDAKKVELNDFMQIDVIKLETNNSVLISHIEELIRFQDYILILDQDRKSLFIFSKEGKIVSKISDYGQGPDEYTTISSFVINSKGNVDIFDNNLKRRMEYNLKGALIRTGKIPFSIRSVDYLSNGEIAVVQNIIDSNKKNGYRVHVLDDDFNSLNNKKFLPYSYVGGTTVFEKNRPLRVVKGNSFYYNSMFSNDVYFYDSKTLIKKFVIDFRGKGIPEDFIRLPEDEYGMSVYKLIINTNYKVATNISVCDEIGTNILFTYGYNRETYYSFYNPQKGACFQFYGPFINKISINNITDAQFYTDAYFCFVLDLEKLSKISLNERVFIEHNYGIIQEKINGWKIDDNPVLIFGKLKINI